MDNSTFILFMFSFVSMTAFGFSIYLIVRARKDSKRLFTMLEDAMDVSFKELQLNMHNVLKRYVIYKKPRLNTVNTETNETIVEVYIQMEAAEKRSCQRRMVPNDIIIIIEDIASDPE